MENITHQARARVERERPDASREKAAAFANAVTYLVTGRSGSGGGPSVREHAVIWRYASQRFTVEEACELLLSEDGLIFGPIRQIHRDVYEQISCFDDDPADLLELTSYPVLRGS